MKHESFTWALVSSTTAADHPAACTLVQPSVAEIVQHEITELRFVVGTSCCGVMPLFPPSFVWRRKIWSRKVAWSLSRSGFYRNRRLPRSKAGQIWLFEKNIQSFLSYLSSVYVVKKLDKVFSLIILRCFIDYHCSFVSSHCFYFLKKLGKFIGIRRYIVIKDTDVFWSADPLRVMRERIV